MVAVHARYPDYEFARHKGYGTELHRARLLEHGPCPEHRRSFAPVRALT
jgi:ribonuclease HII